MVSSSVTPDPTNPPLLIRKQKHLPAVEATPDRRPGSLGGMSRSPIGSPVDPPPDKKPKNANVSAVIDLLDGDEEEEGEGGHDDDAVALDDDGHASATEFEEPPAVPRSRSLISATL